MRNPLYWSLALAISLAVIVGFVVLILDHIPSGMNIPLVDCRQMATGFCPVHHSILIEDIVHIYHSESESGFRIGPDGSPSLPLMALWVDGPHEGLAKVLYCLKCREGFTANIKLMGSCFE